MRSGRIIGVSVDIYDANENLKRASLSTDGTSRGRNPAPQIQQ